MGGAGDLVRRRELEEHAKAEHVGRLHRLKSLPTNAPYWASDHPIIAVLLGAVGFLAAVVLLFGVLL